MATTPPDDAIARDLRKLSLKTEKKKKKKKTRDEEGTRKPSAQVPPGSSFQSFDPEGSYCFQGFDPEGSSNFQCFDPEGSHNLQSFDPEGSSYFQSFGPDDSSSFQSFDPEGSIKPSSYAFQSFEPEGSYNLQSLDAEGTIRPSSYVPFSPSLQSFDPEGSMATPDAIAQGVRELSFLNKKTRGTRNPSKTSSENRNPKNLDPKGPWKPSDNGLPDYPCFQNLPKGFRLVPEAPFGNAREAAMANGGPCPVCSLEHPPCNVCCKVHHASNCPYLNLIPEGSSFNSLWYAVHCCSCGLNYFNEDKWKCPACSGTLAVLREKYCAICEAETHFAYECPFDKAKAAIHKLAREKKLSKYN